MATLRHLLRSKAALSLGEEQGQCTGYAPEVGFVRMGAWGGDAMAVRLLLEIEGVVAGWVEAEDCRNGPSPPELAAEIEAATSGCATDEPAWVTSRKAAVRDMLRHGRYRPTGRGKPASEYLRNAAAEGRFPVVNALVDIINLVSLETMLPVSIVDLDRSGSEEFVLRFGREGESYVFNQSGQVLELRDLLLTARMPGDRPCASPVKDCQETKTDAATRRALVVVYGPLSLHEAVQEATQRIAALIKRHCGGAVTFGALGR